MSTLSVTTIQTKDATTDLSMKTGNSSGPDIVLFSTGGIALSGNSTTNNMTVFSNGLFVIANSTTNTFTINTTGVAVMNGGAVVTGPTNLNGNVTVSSNLSLGANIVTNVVISGTTNSTGNLVVGGTANITGNLVVSGAANIIGNSVISGTANVTGNLTVASDASVTGNLAVSGAASVTGNLVISGTTNVTGNSVISGTSNVTGNLVVGGTANVTGNLVVSGTANVTGNVTATDTITANVFVGSVSNPFNPVVTVASVAGAMLSPSLTASATAGLGLVANRQYFVPVYIPRVFTTTTLACEVTTLGTSSSIRMNLYAADAAGAPTGSPLGADVLVASSTTGVKTGSYVVTLEPGLYWASMVCNATAPTIRGVVPTGAIGISTLGATSIYNHIYGTFTFGTMGAYSGVTSITGVVSGTTAPLMAIY